MRNTNSEQFVKSDLSQESPFVSIAGEFQRDDNDSTSMWSFSMTVFGIFFAFLVILIPSITVLLERPLSQDNEMTFFYLIKKDGS